MEPWVRCEASNSHQATTRRQQRDWATSCGWRSHTKPHDAWRSHMHGEAARRSRHTAKNIREPGRSRQNTTVAALNTSLHTLCTTSYCAAVVREPAASNQQRSDSRSLHFNVKRRHHKYKQPSQPLLDTTRDGIILKAFNMISHKPI